MIARGSGPGRSVWALLVVAGVAACGNERPATVRARPGSLVSTAAVTVTELQPGPPTPERPATNPYEGDGSAMAEGKRLYTWFNCAGCHGANGGGGIGPAFADAEWIYGDDAENIIASIAEGRPNGMPTFGRLVPADRIWKLALYVRSFAPPDTGRGAGQGGSGASP